MDYEKLRAITVDFGIPLRRFATNDEEIEADRLSFFSLMMSSLQSDDARVAFSASEERLLYYRLVFSGVSAVQIDNYFWPSSAARAVILSHSRLAGEDEVFVLPFEEALTILEPAEVLLVGGIVTLKIEQIYELVCRAFRLKILANMKRLEQQFARNDTLIKCLASELEKYIHPDVMLSLDNLNELAARSFPPCMHRIVTSARKSHYATFKGRFELTLFMKSLGLSDLGNVTCIC
jgi:DNA primase large subunit